MKLVLLDNKHVEPTLIDDLASLLASSFAQDPFYRWLFGETEADAIDQDKLFRYFRFFLRVACHDDARIRVLYVDERVVGVTVSVRPGQVLGTAWSALKSGLTSLVWTIGSKAMMRLIREYPRRVHSLDFDFDSHGTLVMIAVSPLHQGKGYANILIEQVKPPIRLEATSKKSMQFYQKRHGYEITATCHFGHGVLDECGRSDSSAPKVGVALYLMAKSDGKASLEVKPRL